MKVSDFLTATMKLIGAIAKNETPDPDEMADAFLRLNSMLDSFQTDRLTIYGVVRTVFPLTNGKQAYTIGKSALADFNVPRPIWIQNATVISNTNPAQPLELPTRLLDDDQWAAVSIKNVQSSLFWYVYYDYAFNVDANGVGLGKVNIWPVLNVSTPQLALYLPTPIAQFASTNDTFILPPGYEEMLRYNLAVRLGIEWSQPVDPRILKIAQESYASVCRANKRLTEMECDPALVGSRRSVFNWLTGSSGSWPQS